MDETLPQIIKTVKDENGVLMYGDEASFQVSGTRSRGWIQKGRDAGKEVESKATRASVKTFGAVTVSDKPKFHFLFSKVFNSFFFLKFLEQLVRQYPNKKIHLILDNARYHHAQLVKKWLAKNVDRIQLHFLPAYSPDMNASEGVWRLSRRKATHNRHFKDKNELHRTLLRRFNRFQGNPASLRSMIAPFYTMMVN